MEWDLTPKPASESEIVLVQAMELTDANLSGNVHGGVIMRLVDTAAGISAHKHSAGRVVTVAMDEMSFLEPIYIGDVVTVRAMVNDVVEDSLERRGEFREEHLGMARAAHERGEIVMWQAPWPSPPTARCSSSAARTPRSPNASPRTTLTSRTASSRGGASGRGPS